MNWFRRSSRSPSIRRDGSNTSRTNGSSPASASSAAAGDDRGAALYEAFRSHWTQANEIVIRQQEEQLVEPTTEQITAVFRHLDQMMLLLVTEVNAQSDLSIGPVLDGLFTENVLQKILLWTFSCTGENAEMCRRSMLRLYEGLLNQSQYCLLVHKPILLPMLTMLEECSRASPQQQPDVEQLFVLLLNQICVKITEKENSPLLEFFFSPSTDEGPPKFLVFTFLIPYLYNEGNVGQLARDALLLLLSVSANVKSVGEFIAEHSNFCPVLATGLSALYSALPRRLASRADDWHRITDDDIDNSGEIRSFYNALEFCNAVVQVGHPLVLERLLDFIYNGFLVSVLGAALHENSLEELIAATAYLELFFRTATESPLLRILLKFILAEQYDGVVLLETLVTRISSNSRLCIVSLALFETLLNLNCEDLLFELILKYLIPCTHIMVSQANNLTDIDYYGKSAQRFLSLIPNCCVTSRSCDISSASSAEELNAGESCSVVVNPRQSGVVTPSVSMENKLLSSAAASSTTFNPLNNGVMVYEYEPEVTVKSREMAYAEYLTDAHQAVSHCASACTCWRFPYDGKTPDPALFREDSPPSTSSSSVATVENNGTATTTMEDSDAGESPRLDADRTALVNGKPKADDKPSADPHAPSESESESKSSGDQQQPPKQAGQPSGSFKRNASFRKSKTNRYYNVRRLSQSTGGNIGTVPELDLTLGGEEGFEDEEDDNDMELDAFETSDDGGPTTAHKPPTKRAVDDSHDSAQSSSGSTPRHHHAKNDAMSTSMPADYFKLAFDDESLYGGVSDSQEESDIGGNPGHQYVLRGWSQIQDMKTFMEVLNRVRASRTIGQQSAEELMGYIEGAHDLMQRTASESSDDGGQKAVEATMALSKDSGVDVDDANRGEDAAPAVIRIPLKSSFASPNIGPFLSVLLHKLDNMLQNSLFMNLHLTGVLARLACFPQVLITSFLLNYSLVFQPAVRSLHQVLTSLRHKVDSYACTVENFDTLLLRGRIFLLQRERRHEMNQRRRHSRSDSVRASSTTTNSSGGGGGGQSSGSRKNDGGESSGIDGKNPLRIRSKKPDGRLRSITNLFQSHSSASRDDGSRQANRRTGSLTESPSHRGYQHFGKSQSTDLTLEAMKTKNVVYCAIVLEEFLKELAAISQEHAVRRGDSLQQQQHPAQPTATPAAIVFSSSPSPRT